MNTIRPGRILVAGAFLVLTLLTATPASAAAPPVNIRATWPCVPSTVYLDPAAPPDVVSATLYWHRMFRPDWQFTDDPTTATIVILTRPPTFDPGAAGNAVTYATSTTRVRAVVEVDPRMTATRHNTTLHELGHVAGLTHSDDSASVMYEYALPGKPARYTVNELAWMRVAANRCVK